MKFIVTGGAGFIGSALCRMLINEHNAQILNIDKLTYAANLASLSEITDNQNYQFLNADICDQQQMNDAIHSFAPDGIFHLAAESHVDRSITGSADFINTNIIGTHILLESALAYWNSLHAEKRANFRFLHVSTDEVYGSLGNDGLFCETTAYDPSSPYSASKAASDHLVTAWNRTYGFPTLISNCSNNYGPYQFPEKLIPLMILNALQSKPLPIYGKGDNIRDWLYVDDHARALILTMRKGRIGETYNIGGNNEFSNVDVVQQICAIMDKFNPKGAPHNSLIKYVTDRPGHDMRYAIDAGKIKQELGWKAQENFTSGLEKTVHWYLSNSKWWNPEGKGSFDRKRLGITDNQIEGAN